MSPKELRQKLTNALASSYDERERQNVVDYYFDAVTDPREAKLDADIIKLQQGVPVQYVTQTSFFYEHRFYVDNAVLIPRPETEELVHWVVTEHKHQEGLELLDIGTGSGCILLSILSKLRSASGTGLDISEEILSVFEKNNTKLETRAQSIRASIFDVDILDHLGYYDIIVSNPPYILTSEMDRMGENVVSNEPKEALFVDGEEPLVFYERIINLSKDLLNDKGSLYFETSDLYHADLKKIAADSELSFEFKKDLQDNWRMLKLTKD